jgi:hypothetical protein
MPLYRKPKPKIFKNDTELVGNTNAPNAYVQPVPERNIDFVNAKPLDNSFILSALQSVKSQETILGTNLPIINNESTTEKYIKPIFLGKIGEPTEEFLYANPNSYLNYETKSDCEKVFLFANLQAKKSNRGFNKLVDKKDTTIPNVLTNKEPSNSNEKYQLLFFEQTDNNSKIKLNAYDFVVENVGKGISTIVSSPIELDTWFNKKINNSEEVSGRSSRWIDYNIGDNVTIGATNDTITKRNPGERYNWSFGSIFIVKSFGSNNQQTENDVYREIKYEFDTINGNLTLQDWDIEFKDSPTTYSDRYASKVTLFDSEIPTVSEERLTKEEIANGVVGRKIYTYLIKAFEEGECIRIEEVYGGIRINVDFNYNGRCCEKFITSSSSQELCFSLVADNINEYELNDGKICVKFEGDDDQIGYVRICGDDIPVSTKNGFLTWNYGLVDEYIFEIFNECQGFYTTSGCYYEVCFNGYPDIKFSLQVISRSSSSTSSVSYSSSSSSSSKSSMGNSSSSSSFMEKDSSSSSLSSSFSSKSNSSSSSSFSSKSRSSSSSDVSSSSRSTSSSSSSKSKSSNSSSSSSRSTSSSSSSSNLLSESSLSDSSFSSSSMKETSLSSSSISSKYSNSSPSSEVSSNSSLSAFEEDSFDSDSSDSSILDASLDDLAIIYTNGIELYSLSSNTIGETEYGIVAGASHGTVGGLNFEKAFMFDIKGNVINTLIESIDPSTGTLLHVYSQYFPSIDLNLNFFSGKYFYSNGDGLNSSSLKITDQTLENEYELYINDDPSPFSDNNTSEFGSLTKIYNGYLFIAGNIFWKGQTGFFGFPIEAIDTQNRKINCVTASEGSNDDANVFYDSDYGFGGGMVRDIIPHKDFYTNGKLWAVGDFTTPKIGITHISGDSPTPSFAYQLYKNPYPTAGKAYSLCEIETFNQDVSSLSESSKSSRSSRSLSDSSQSSPSSLVSTSSSIQESSLSDFSSKSSASSNSALDISSQSSPSSNSSPSESPSQSFGYTQKTIIVAGDFDLLHDGVTPSPRKNIAFFTEDGVLLGYKLIQTCNGTIRKVIYDNHTNTIYIAGEFTTVTDLTGTLYNDSYLAAFKLNANDKATRINLPFRVIGGPIYDMKIISNRIFICGKFEGFSGAIYRPGLGAFNRYNFTLY